MKQTTIEQSTLEKLKVINNNDEFDVSVEWKFEKKTKLPPAEEIERWLKYIGKTFVKNVLEQFYKELNNQGQDLQGDISKKG